jgi:hypothetical protein
MNTQIARATLRTSIKHPRAAAWVATSAAKRPRGTAEAFALALHASRVMKNVAQPGVRDELSAAAGDLAKAVARARQIGAKSAPADKRIAKNLDTAMDHLSTAIDRARGRRRRHTGRRLVVVFGALAGGTYAVWKVSSASLSAPSDSDL